MLMPYPLSSEIFSSAKYFFNPHAIPPLMAALLIGLLGAKVVCHKAAAPNFYFGGICLSIIVWLSCTAIGYCVKSDELLAAFWFRMDWVGVSYISVAIYGFASHWLHQGRRWILAVGFAIATFFNVLILTSNPLMLGVRKYGWGYFPLHDHQWSPILLAFFFAYMLLSFFAFVEGYRQATSASERNGIKYLFLGFLIAYIASQDYLPTFGIAVYPLGFVWISVFIALCSYAIVRHQLMDITIVIRKTLLYSMVTAGLASIYAGVVTLLARQLEANISSPAFFGTQTFEWIAANLRLSFAYSCIATSVFSAGFSVFVWLKGRDRLVNQLWALTCLAIGAWSLGLGMMTRSASWGGAYAWQTYVQYPGAIMIPILFLHFVMRVLSVRTRAVLALGYLMAALLLVLNASGRLASIHVQPPFHYYTIPLQLYRLFVVYFFLLVIYAHALLLWKMMTAEKQLRNQARYIFVGTFVGFAGGSTTFFYVFGRSIFPYGDYAVPLYIVTVSYAIFKHQLMDINVVIRKTLLYSLVSAVLASIYVGTITLLAYVLQEHHGQATAYSSALAAVFITLLFNPLRSRLQSVIDRLFARTRLDLEGKMAEFSSTIVGEQDPRRVTEALFRALNEGFSPMDMALFERNATTSVFEKTSSVRPEWPFLEAGVIDGMARGMSQTQPFLVHSQRNEYRSPFSQAGVAVVVPLQSRGQWIGCLLIGEKKSEESYSEEDLTLLGIMANQAAVIYERPRLIREVSGGFVHEVKMPLSKISLPAELTYLEIEKVKKGAGLTDEFLDKIQKRMKYIMEQTVIAGQRVDALRELTAVEERKRGRVTLMPLLQRCLDALEEMIQRLSIKVSINVPQDLPAIVGDQEQLEIIFTNLFKNAVEAMADLPEGLPRQLQIHAGIQGGMLQIEVSDTGVGIKLEDQGRMFHSHFSTKGPQGAGMGLFLCRQVVEAHGGTIVYAPGSRKGACFVVTLPNRV